MNAPKFGNGRSNPYVAFKDDCERRRALVSRDVRLVVVALILVIGGVPAAGWQAVWKYFGGG